MSHSNRFARFGPAIIVGTAILWSLDAFIRSTSLYALPPTLLSFWEHFLGIFLIIPFFAFNWRDVNKLTKKEWIAISLVALFGGPIGLVAYTYALTQVNYANFSIVMLLQQTQPIWAILMAGILLKEKITPKFLGLALLAMAGVYLIVFKDLVPNLNTGAGTAIAGGLALVSAFAWGSNTSLGKFVINKVDYGTIAFLRFVLASLFSLIAFLLFVAIQSALGLDTLFGRNHSLAEFFVLQPAQWLNLGLVVLMTGATAMLLYYVGLKRTPARVATICELAWPASSLLIGVLVFKNTFTPTQILGIVILLVSVLVISYTQKEA